MNNPYSWIHGTGNKEMKDFYLCRFCDSRKHKRKLIFLTANYWIEQPGGINQEVWSPTIICKKCYKGNLSPLNPLKLEDNSL